MEPIGIIGVGWLGKAIALQLKEAGTKVFGTTTSEDKKVMLEGLGISAYLYSLGGQLPEEIAICNVILVTVPPRGDQYINQLRQLENSLSPSSWIIYISSTSVYPDNDSVVFEEDAENRQSSHTGISLLEAEQVFWKSDKDCTIIRMAGLFGPDRHPGKFLAGKTNVSGAQNPVNLVHLDDCVSIIESIITMGIKNEILNACSDEHPAKEVFYTEAAKWLGLDPPQFDTSTSHYKIVNNTKSKKLLNYNYKYPNPLLALELI